MGPVEHKWLARIIGGDLKCGFQGGTVFKQLHPNARALYDR